MENLDKKYEELLKKKQDLEKKIKIKRLEEEIQNLEQELSSKSFIIYSCQKHENTNDSAWWDYLEKQLKKGFY